MSTETADLYLKAAQQAHESQTGYMHLVDSHLYGRYRDAIGYPDATIRVTKEMRVLALCFMVAMVEAGDA